MGHDLAADHLCNVQSWDRQFSGDLLQDYVRCVIRTHVEMRPGVRDLLHTLG